MQRSNVRLLAPTALAAVLTAATTSPAHAAVEWDGDADNGGTAVFATVVCDDPSYVYQPDWNDGRGTIFAFTKAVGSERCEGLGIAGRTLTEDRTYWFGWESMTKTGNAQTVFQWKSWGTDAEQDQNYPVLMKVEDSLLKIWYVAPGEEWIAAGSIPWTPGTWNKIELGINARSSTGGSFALYVNGQLVVDRHDARTWDLKGNVPRWGTYGSTITGVESVNWVDGLKMGTTREDVD
ncbi:polysaccharide lyase [Streptomyces sp. NBC_00335]|uniref:heparin lyase I family protein n=1 Tax=unclassified Streptomyces TaxID=2593676 RepID=UPI002256F508|nr:MULTISPECIES: heparin lyase I family protein [unclassified Streptomyces]MCX5402973.1 polysaccharide lyase [Streptomyces sp. NBC_00086]